MIYNVYQECLRVVGTFDVRLPLIVRKMKFRITKDTSWLGTVQFIITYSFLLKKMFVVPLTFSADLVYLPSSLNLVGSHSWKIHVLHYSLQSDMIFSTRTQQKSSWKILWLCFKKENSVYSCAYNLKVWVSQEMLVPFVGLWLKLKKSFWVYDMG